MEQIAIRLTQRESWTYLAGDNDAKKDLEVVVRAFDRDAMARTGTSRNDPDGEEVLIPVGQGRRLIGKHFFAKPAGNHDRCLISYRGVE